MRKALLIVCLFVLMGCYDRLYGPALVSNFAYPITVKGVLSGKEFNYIMTPGTTSWHMEKDRQYEQISVYRTELLLYTVTQDEMNNKIGAISPKEVIWKLSEEGVELITLKEMLNINKKLYKPKNNK